MDSESFFQYALDYALDKENTFFIIIGSDSGLLLPWLAKQTLGRGSRIAIIEHHDIYHAISNKYRGIINQENDVTEIQSKISLHCDTDWHETLLEKINSKYFHAGQTTIMESHASITDYSKLYIPLCKSVKIALREHIQHSCITINRQDFTEKQFANAIDNNTPLQRSVNFGESRTAIVLGGGPSLDHHINWVKENQDKLFIIAVSRLASMLMEIDLKPDAIVSVDPTDISYEVSKKGILWEDVPLLYNFHVSPKLLQQWQGPTFYLGKRFPWHTKKELDGFIASAGPTVSHSAVFVASQLSFSKILMSGIDFCFTESGSTHSSDSPEEYIQKMPSFCEAIVETYSGRTAATSTNMLHSVKPMDELGKLVNRNKPILYNLNNEAAKCESIPHISINDVVLDQLKPRLIEHTGQISSEMGNKHLDEIEKELASVKHTLGKLRILSKDAKFLINKMISSNENSLNSKNSFKLSRIRKKIETDYSDFLEAIIYINGLAFSKTELPTEFEDMSSDELLNWGKDYYALIESGTKNLISYIDGVDSKLQLRRDELVPDCDIRKIAKRWREDSTPGRILKWKKLHGKNISGPDKAWVQRAIGKFRSTLNDSNKKLGTQVQSSHMRLASMLRSIDFFKENNKINELKAIEPKMASNEWPYCALHPYISATIHDLRGNTSEANAQYQSSVDICSNRLSEKPDTLPEMQRLIENCLVRMTQCYMSINEHQSALTTLGLLCEMLPNYIVTYAKMLYLVGEQGYAKDLMVSYTELYPGDRKASLLLAQYQEDMKGKLEPDGEDEYARAINSAMQAIMG